MSRAWFLVGPSAFLLLWAGVVGLQWVNPVLLPGPLTVGRELLRLCGGPIYSDLAATLARALGGLGLAILLGIPAGLLLGSSPRLERSVSVGLDLYRSLPAVALIPIFAIFFGIGELAKLLTAVGAVLPIVVVSTSYGVHSGRATRRLLVRSLQMTRWQALWLVVLPEALPHLFSGLRIAVSVAATVAVAAEMFLGAAHGLGRRIADAQLFFRVPELFATVLVAGAVGYGLNRVVVAFERRALHWVGH